MPTQEEFVALQEQVALHQFAHLIHAEWDRITAKLKKGAKLTNGEIAWLANIAERARA